MRSDLLTVCINSSLRARAEDWGRFVNKRFTWKQPHVLTVRTGRPPLDRVAIKWLLKMAACVSEGSPSEEQAEGCRPCTLHLESHLADPPTATTPSQFPKLAYQDVSKKCWAAEGQGMELTECDSPIILSVVPRWRRHQSQRPEEKQQEPVGNERC